MLLSLVLIYSLQLTVIQPFTGTVFKSQDSISIKWSIDGKVPENVKFALLDGRKNMNNADLVMEISEIETSDLKKSLNFKLNVNVVTGSSFFIRACDADRVKDCRYSPAFTILGDKEATPQKPIDSSENGQGASDDSIDTSSSILLTNMIYAYSLFLL